MQTSPPDSSYRGLNHQPTWRIATSPANSGERRIQPTGRGRAAYLGNDRLPDRHVVVGSVEVTEGSGSLAWVRGGRASADRLGAALQAPRDPPPLNTLDRDGYPAAVCGPCVSTWRNR
jgi:hypothetical protein